MGTELMGRVLETMRHLTPPESSVLRLEEMAYDPPAMCKILGTTLNELATLQAQAKAKIREGYRFLS